MEKTKWCAWEVETLFSNGKNYTLSAQPGATEKIFWSISRIYLVLAACLSKNISISLLEIGKPRSHFVPCRQFCCFASWHLRKICWGHVFDWSSKGSAVRSPCFNLFSWLNTRQAPMNRICRNPPVHETLVLGPCDPSNLFVAWRLRHTFQAVQGLAAIFGTFYFHRFRFMASYLAIFFFRTCL